MITTLVGENSFALKNELKKYIHEYLSKYGELSVEQIDCSEADTPTITASLSSPPLLSAKKLVVLRQVSANKDLSQNLPEQLEQIPETTDVIIVQEQIDKRLSLYKFLKGQTDYKECNALDLPQTINWLVSSAGERGASISSHDARYLVERVGMSQERLDSEMTKLLLCNKSITKEHINQMTEANPSSTIFDLLEAAFNGNHRRVIDLYEQQRQIKVEPQQIMSMLTWQLHVFIIINASGNKNPDLLSREAGLNPFVVRKSAALSKRLPLQRLNYLVNKLVKLDIASKSRSIDLDDGLTHYLLSI